MALSATSHRTYLAVGLALFIVAFLVLSIHSSPSPFINALVGTMHYSSETDVEQPGSTMWSPVTYLPYTFGFAMLEQTLEGYRRAGWRDIVIVDNSWDHHALAEIERLTAAFPVIDIVPTPVHLRFAQLQAYMDHLALDSGAPAYLWSHTDILVLYDDSTHPNCSTSYEAAVNSLIKGAEDHEAPGVAFFNYDRLSGVYTNAARAAPWDPAMPQYGADCDRYHRIRMSGHEIFEGEYRVPLLHVHTILGPDAIRTLYESDMTVAKKEDFVKEITEGAEQYAWREASRFDKLTEMDQKAASAEDLGGRQYFLEKWGEPFECEIEGRKPRFKDDRILDGYRSQKHVL